MTEQTLNIVPMDQSIIYGQEWLQWAMDSLMSVEEEQVKVLIDRGPEYAGRLFEAMEVYRGVHALPVTKELAESVIMVALYGYDERRKAQWAYWLEAHKLLERVAAL